MSLMNVFGIAGSALSAQSLRLNVTASNLANADSMSSSIERTYRARHPVFATVYADALGATEAPAGGVEVRGIVESQAPLARHYMPEHPEADADGYVFQPNVSLVEEMANMMSASRSYQSNVEVMNASRQMLMRTLSMGR